MEKAIDYLQSDEFADKMLDKVGFKAEVEELNRLMKVLKERFNIEVEKS